MWLITLTVGRRLEGLDPRLDRSGVTAWSFLMFLYSDVCSSFTPEDADRSESARNVDSGFLHGGFCTKNDFISTRNIV